MRESDLGPTPTPRAEFLAGVRSEIPIVLGVIPFGLIFGVLARQAGLPPALGQSMSLVVFAGSAQFIGVELFAAGAPALLILATTFMVNLRHVLYSASLAPFVSHLPARWKWSLAYLLTDEAFATAVVHYHRPGPVTHRHWFFLGAGLGLWLPWKLSTAAGILLGAAIPDGWGLDLTLALTFIGIVVPTLNDRPHAGAALSAGIVAVVAAALPYRLGLMAAALVGITVGVLLERSSGKRSTAAAAAAEGEA
jgi:4-azaleucine resistance transporter AzlC